jgi:hypothetical protein
MSRTTPVLEDRLARYRPTLDGAIAERTAIASTDHLLTGTDLVELDWQPVEPGRSSNRSRVLVGASAVVMIGGLAVIVATRDTPPVTPANSVTPVDTDASDESTAPSEVVIVTAPATTIAGSTALAQFYAAAEGDSASSVAAMFDVTTVELVEFNGWADGSSHPLVAGDTVLVPPGARTVANAIGSLGELVLTDGSAVSVGLTGDQSGICLLTPEAIGGCDGTPATLSPVYVVASGQDENQHQLVYGVVDDGLVVTLLTPIGEIPVTTSEASEGRRGFAILNTYGAGVTLIVRDGAANEISRTPVGA